MAAAAAGKMGAVQVRSMVAAVAVVQEVAQGGPQLMAAEEVLAQRRLAARVQLRVAAAVQGHLLAARVPVENAW
mgnify:CR=1 FL=1